MSQPKKDDEQRVVKMIADMREAELLKFLSDTSASLVAAVDRLEALADDEIESVLLTDKQQRVRRQF